MSKMSEMYIDLMDSGQYDQLMDESYQRYLSDKNQHEQYERTRSIKTTTEGQCGKHSGVSETDQVSGK